MSKKRKKIEKQPYIPLYIGDWEQDTNTISLEAEGALLKLTFKLWKSKEKGFAEFCLPQICLLLKKDEKSTLEIIHELADNDILNIEFLEAKKIRFISRRMFEKARISKIRSEAGKEGIKKKLSKSEANVQQNPDIDIDNDNSILLNKKEPEKKNPRKPRAPKLITTVPEITEMENYAEENGYPRELGARAFKTYSNNNPPWHDSKGNPVRSWRGKMQSVWFKPENKIAASNGSKVEKIISAHTNVDPETLGRPMAFNLQKENE